MGSLAFCASNAWLKGRVSNEPRELKRESLDARFSHVAVHRSFLRPGVSLRQGLPEVEVTPMQIDVVTAVALVLSVLLLGYLTITLLFPERF
jgi:K+-transporting ATPase KdpF subunit